MLDTLTIARRLTAAGLEPTQANAITAPAIRTAADSGDTATKADLAMLRADLYRAPAKMPPAALMGRYPRS